MYFIGWSQNADSTNPETVIVPDADTVLYAVYTDKPHFHFEANMSGWKPNSATKSASVANGKLHYSANTAADMFLSLEGITLDAGSYPIMRIKRKYYSGNPDGMFFSILNGKGFSQATRINLASGTLVGSDGQADVYEYYITEMSGISDYRKGTVTGLRYDVLGYDGQGYTDYIVFTDKKAVFPESLSVKTPVFGENTGEITFEKNDADNHYSVKSAVWNSGEKITAGQNTVVLTLAPDNGYEFTTAEDISGNLLINGASPESTEIKENGEAVVTLSFDVDMICTDAENSWAVTVGFGKNLYDTTVIAAAYTDNGKRVRELTFAENVTLENKDLTVIINPEYSYKFFVFGDLESLRVYTWAELLTIDS